MGRNVKENNLISLSKFHSVQGGRKGRPKGAGAPSSPKPRTFPGFLASVAGPSPGEDLEASLARTPGVQALGGAGSKA